ncbi:MAG: hypothetical protein ACI9JL_002588 [Paracoccaceae bacterium]|jgi:hypothetical protein
MSIRQVVYVSSGSREYTAAELEDVIATGRRNNAANDLTGILLYYHGNFMQPLEGAADAVEETFQRISADERHTGILKLQDTEVEARSFPDYAMGFRAIASTETTALPELFENLGAEWRVKPGAGIDGKLIMLFRTFFKINSGSNA